MKMLELKNTITIKNSLTGLDSRIEGIEEGIKELENRTIEIT